VQRGNDSLPIRPAVDRGSRGKARGGKEADVARAQESARCRVEEEDVIVDVVPGSGHDEAIRDGDRRPSRHGLVRQPAHVGEGGERAEHSGAGRRAHGRPEDRERAFERIVYQAQAGFANVPRCL